MASVERCDEEGIGFDLSNHRSLQSGTLKLGILLTSFRLQENVIMIPLPLGLLSSLIALYS